MGRKRVIYQSEVLYTKPIQYHEYLNQGDQLLRVQDISHGVELNRTDINEFGQLEAIERKIIEPPTVNLDFSYYLHGGRNENLIGFSMTPGTASGTTLVNSMKKFISGDSGQNYYIGVSAEGEDGKGDSSSSRGVIGIGNGYVTSYSMEAAVGDIPSASVSIEASNLEFNGAIVEGGVAAAIDVPNPAIDPETSERYATNDISYFPYSTHTGEKLSGSNYEFAALRPGDIEIDFNAGPDADSAEGSGSAGGISVGGAIVEGSSKFHVQSFNLDVPLSRETLNRIGSVYPYSREVETPMTVTFTCSAFLSDLDAGNLNDILCSSNERNIRIKMKEPCPSDISSTRVAQEFLIKGATLESQNFSASIGDNKTVDLTFSAQIGGANSTTKGLFMWQAGEVQTATNGGRIDINDDGTHMINLDLGSGDVANVNFTVSGGNDVYVEFSFVDADTLGYEISSDGEIAVGTIDEGNIVVEIVGGNEVVINFISVGSYNVEVSASPLPTSVAEEVAVGETVEAVAEKLVHVSAPDIDEVGEEIDINFTVDGGNDVAVNIPYDSTSGRMRVNIDSGSDSTYMFLYAGDKKAIEAGGNIIDAEGVDPDTNEVKIKVKKISTFTLGAFNVGIPATREQRGYNDNVTNLDFSANDAVSFAAWVRTKPSPSTSDSSRHVIRVVSDNTGEPTLALGYEREDEGDKKIEKLTSAFRRTSSSLWDTDEEALPALLDNEVWAHVGLVLNASTGEGKFYYNGSQLGSTFTISSGALNENGGTKSIFIGAISSGIPDDADFSELGMWSKELSAAEFAELADDSSQFKLTTDFGDYASEADLVAYFPGVNPGYRIMLDYSGNGNHVVMTQTDFEFRTDGPYSS